MTCRPPVTPRRASAGPRRRECPGGMTRRERLAKMRDELDGWRFVGALDRLATSERPYRPQPWLAVADMGAYYFELQLL
jgi:hypothetical protein